MAFVPGRAAYLDGRGGSSMRLNFSGVSEDDLREGVRRIGKVVNEQVRLYSTLTGKEPPAPRRAQGEHGRGRQRRSRRTRSPAAAARRRRAMSRVAVLEGGQSLERQVSLRSGARVRDALERLGHDVLGIDVGPDLVERLTEARADVAFVALHGRDGEDGTVQEILELVGIPYTASGPSACMRCMDKVLAKHALRDAGLPTPDFYAFSQTAFESLGAAHALPAIEERLDFPVVVKPAAQGSALGIRFAPSAAEVPAAIVAAFSYDTKVLLERHVAGRELAVSVVDGPDGPEALPVVEAIPRGGDRYDFEARYEIGRTDFVCPAELDAATTEAAQSLALDAYRVLGCYGFARIDLMLETASGELTVLEANAIPGLTETSLLPQAAEAGGLSFDAFVARVLDLALRGRRPEPASAVLAGAEVLGRDLVEELLELVHDLLGVLDLVLELDRGLGDHVLGGEDRRARPDRQRERVARPRVDLDLAAVHRQRDRRVERVLAQLRDGDAGAGDIELAEHLEEQVVRHRPRRGRSLELHQDGGRLRMADPDRQELVRSTALSSTIGCLPTMSKLTP